MGKLLHSYTIWTIWGAINKYLNQAEQKFVEIWMFVKRNEWKWNIINISYQVNMCLVHNNINNKGVYTTLPQQAGAELCQVMKLEWNIGQP